MRFFTMQEWIEDCDQKIDPVPRVIARLKAYDENIRSIKDRFSPDLKRFVETVNLCDGYLTGFSVDCSKSTAAATFDAADMEWKHGYYATMHYTGVKQVVVNPLKMGFSALGLGDILRDEFYLDDRDCLVHGIMFSNAVELEIHFEDCTLDIRDMPSPVLPDQSSKTGETGQV